MKKRAEFLLSHNGKHFFEKYPDPDPGPYNFHNVAVASMFTETTLVKIFMQIRQVVFMQRCSQTARQTERLRIKHTLFGGGNRVTVRSQYVHRRV